MLISNLISLRIYKITENNEILFVLEYPLNKLNTTQNLKNIENCLKVVKIYEKYHLIYLEVNNLPELFIYRITKKNLILQKKITLENCTFGEYWLNMMDNLFLLWSNKNSVFFIITTRS